MNRLSPQKQDYLILAVFTLALVLLPLTGR